jgi:hypothetical protein
MKTKRTFTALYSFPGFRARARLKGIFGDPYVRVVELQRTQKKRPVRFAGRVGGVFTITASTGCETWTVEEPAFTWSSNTGESLAGSVAA